MYKLRPFLPLQTMKNVYYSLIHSHLVYGIEVWGSAYKTDTEQTTSSTKKSYEANDI